MSAVLFNRKASESIEKIEANRKAKLDTLTPPQGSSIAAAIPGLQDGSIIVKTLWEVVDPSIPHVVAWDPDPAKAIQENPGGSLGVPGTVNWIPNWLKVRSPDNTCSPDYYPFGQSSTVAIGCFRSIYITQDNIGQIDQKALAQGGLLPGDSIVLVGVHIIEKVKREWVWSTFWWTNNPGYYAQHSGGVSVGGKWSHYVMKSTRDNDTIPLSNPYIEGADSHTTELNCITCHRYAVYPVSSKEQEISNGHYPNGLSGTDETSYFAGRVQTDRLWSLVTKYLQ